MERIAAKFGGSSVADAAQFSKVAAIVAADPRRRVIVVSAPGRRQQDEPKITDLLYLCYDMATMGTDIGEPFGMIRRRFVEISDELGLDSTVAELFSSFRRDLENGCSRDYAASRGEYFCARLMARYLQAECVDPADHIVIRPDGTVARESYESLAKRLQDQDRLYVMAGFYGRGQDGAIKTFSRGGSDISGAIAARAARAVLYENWTDTSGILMADPRIVESPRCIEEISFREVREMSYMGASVFHDEAILPVREAAIPICIKNTNRPGDRGTRIVPHLSQQTVDSTEIAGISGKKSFAMISLEKTLMNKELGFVYRLLGILRQYNISFEHCPSSIDSLSVIVEESRLAGMEETVLDDIRRQLSPDQVVIEHDLALIAVVGEGMARTVGIAGKLFAALAQAGINVRIINQGASEINIIIGVAEGDYEAAIRAVYAAFVPAANDRAPDSGAKSVPSPSSH